VHFYLRSLGLVVLVVGLAGSAWAVPAKFTQQGRLLGVGGQPLTGPHSLSFALYDVETGGVERWSEQHSAEIDNGYYTVTLGQNTLLDTVLFLDNSLWLEVSVDGVLVEPRQELTSVPWALRASSAESVDGGAVNASSVSVGGGQVIDGAGAWVGPVPDVGWTDLTGVPLDIADGDLDTDTLADLVCLGGEVAKWDEGAQSWQCATDLDTNTQLTESEVDGFVADNNYSVGPHTVDTDTQLTEGEVDAFVANNNYSVGLHTVDTDTQLTEGEVDAFVANNNYSVGSHTVNTDTLGDLVCGEGQIAQFAGGQWSCADLPPPNPGVPSGLVGFFASVCPVGWSEFTAMRGRVVVGLPAGGVSAASVGVALVDQGARTINEVGLHDHSVDPPAGTVDSSATNHNHTLLHSHTVDPPSVQVTGGDHNHGTPSEPIGNGGNCAQTGGAICNSTLDTTPAGGHTHTVDIAPFSTTALSVNNTGFFGGSHSHGYDPVPFTSDAAGVASVDVTMPYLQLIACLSP